MLLEFQSPQMDLAPIVQPSNEQVQEWLNNFGSKYRDRYMDSGTFVQSTGGRKFVGVNELAIGESAALEFVLGKLGQGEPIRRMIGYLRVGRYREEKIATPTPSLQEADVRAILLQYEASEQEAYKRMSVGDLVGGRLLIDKFSHGVSDQLDQVLTVLGQRDQVTTLRAAISDQANIAVIRERGTRNLIWRRNDQL